MRTRLLTLVAIASLLPAGAVAAPRGRLVRRPTVACAAVEGIPAVGVSIDGGLSVLPHLEPAETFDLYTFGLVVTPNPRVIAAVGSRLLLYSEDAGCSWRPDGRFVFSWAYGRLTALADGALLAWSPLGAELYRIGSTVEISMLPTSAPLDLWTLDGRALAVSDATGTAWWSDDGGSTWTRRIAPPSALPLYAVTFDPSDRRHVVAGHAAGGASVTFDGGETWRPSAGLPGFNVFAIAISPVDPARVWAIVLDRSIEEGNRRAIAHSTDGGASFRIAIHESDDLAMQNGFTLAPHPTDPSRLWFALPGTDLLLIDDAGTILQRSRLPYRNINAIAFSPLSFSVLYFGLRQSPMTAGP